MPKTIIWVLLAIVVVVGGYTLTKKDNKQVNTFNIYNDNPTEVKDTGAKKMAFSEFIKNPNGSYKCEVKQALNDFENTGTVYISSGKIKGDYTTVAEGRTIKTSFVMRDGYSYMWGDMMAGSGFKVKISADTAASVNADLNASGVYSWNAEQIGEYNCESWIATDAIFKLPTNVTFKDISDLSTPSIPAGSASASLCNASKGSWSAQYKECNGINENTCKAIGGVYNGCASACRHDPKAEVCTMQCVEICTLK